MSKCNGIVSVSGYTRSDGTEVSSYERICPYDHDDKNENTSPANIKSLKTKLYKLGYYKPESHSEPNGQLHDTANQNFTDAIREFQKDNCLPATGNMNSITEMYLNISGPLDNKYKFNTNDYSFKEAVNIKQNQVAVFDGKSLSIYENDWKVRSWNGVSGAKDFQASEHQDVAGKGPLPEGIYVLRQSEHQTMPIKDAIIRLNPLRKAGEWPGSYYSWGTSRVWLEPAQQNNMYGRSNFTVHGGMEPGSSGCIDLTSQMSSFSKWFETNNGKDVIIRVKY